VTDERVALREPTQRTRWRTMTHNSNTPPLRCRPITVSTLSSSQDWEIHDPNSGTLDVVWTIRRAITVGRLTPDPRSGTENRANLKSRTALLARDSRVRPWNTGKSNRSEILAHNLFNS
jgi:hypothetical protein